MKKARKVVLDTNIIISSLWGGNALEIMKMWKSGQLTVAVSADVLEEYTEVLSRFNVTEEDMEVFMELFMATEKTVFIKPGKKIEAVRKDKKDNKFLECAAAAAVEAIISGDRHLLELVEFQGIRIWTMADFLKDFSGK
jgi:uncharacterized protein